MGWLLPEHVKAGQGEPLMGDWFLPQGEGLRAGRQRQQVLIPIIKRSTP
jgi:hypothetical protein